MRQLFPSWDTVTEIELFMWAYADVEAVAIGTMSDMVRDMVDASIYTDEGREVKGVWAITKQGPTKCLMRAMRQGITVRVRVTWLDTAAWLAGEDEMSSTVVRTARYEIPNV